MLDELEVSSALAAPDAVLVDKCREDLTREVTHGERISVGLALDVSLDRQAVLGKGVAKVQLLVCLTFANKCETQLIQGETEVVDFIKAEAQAAGKARGSDASNPKELGKRRHSKKNVSFGWQPVGLLIATGDRRNKTALYESLSYHPLQRS